MTGAHDEVDRARGRQGEFEINSILASKRSTRRVTLRDTVADEIRRRVFTARILPGQRVDQDALASELGMSRVPVREALITLHEEGLIENIAHRGAFAAERAAVAMTDADRDALVGLLDEMERVFAAGVAADADRLNFRFHQRIHRLARSRRLASVIRGLSRAIPTEFYETHSTWPAKAHEDHVRIAAALSAGDSDRARQETEWHFADGGARAVEHLEELGFWAYRTTPA